MIMIAVISVGIDGSNVTKGAFQVGLLARLIGANSTNYRHLLHVMIARVEKLDGLTTTVLAQAPRPQRPKLRVVGLSALLLGVFVFAVAWHHADLLDVLLLSATRLGRHGGVKVCPQADALYPERHAELWRSLGREFDGNPFTTRAVAWLGGAVRIPYV